MKSEIVQKDQKNMNMKKKIIIIIQIAFQKAAQAIMMKIKKTQDVKLKKMQMQNRLSY